MMLFRISNRALGSTVIVEAESDDEAFSWLARFYPDWSTPDLEVEVTAAEEGEW